MNRSQVAMLLLTLHTAYPNTFYKDMTAKDTDRIIDLWLSIFKDEDVETVKIAVKNIIKTFKYPPTIADIIAEIKNIGE